MFTTFPQQCRIAEIILGAQPGIIRPVGPFPLEGRRMRFPAIYSARLFASVVLLIAGSFAFCPWLQAQNNPSSATSQCTAAAGVSQNAQSIEDAAKSFGSIFKKKTPPSASTAAAPCPSHGSSSASPQSAAAPWAPPSNTPSATLAPAAPLDPAKLPDVLGIHLGMPRADASAALLKLYPGIRFVRRGPTPSKEWA